MYWLSQATDWEKIFAKHKSHKGLLCRIYKAHLKLNNMKKNSLIKTWAENFNRNFTLEDVQMANKYMKRCPTLLIIKEIQVKNTMKYNYTLIRKAGIKKIDNARYW